jgi:hypothetical protein
MGEINQYMAMYYDTRFKEEAECRIIIAQRKFDEMTKEERDAEGLQNPMKQHLAIRSETAREFWLTESDATKEEVRAQIEVSYKDELEDWNTKQELPKTAQEYHQYVMNILVEMEEVDLFTVNCKRLARSSNLLPRPSQR